MTNFSNFDNSENLIHSELENFGVVSKTSTADSITRMTVPTLTEEDPIAKNNGKALVEFFEEFFEKLKQALINKATEGTPITHWIDIAGPILRSGGKTVAVILALGFVSIPLMVSGGFWVALILAIGASTTAIFSGLYSS